MSRSARARQALPPPLDVLLIRRIGAPAKPNKTQLVNLFQQAWLLAPRGRRHAAPENLHLAIDVMMVDDDEIARLNVAHLKKRGPTDVLSFPMGEIDPERNAYNLGEIIVSFETARRESTARGLDYADELSRYCVHGFLHLLGYEDATTTQRGEMFEIQEKALKRV